MRNEYKLSDFKRLFELAETHKLHIDRTIKKECGNTVFETQWLNELNEDNIIVARFRAWTQLSTTPPYRAQKGWERYSVKGELMDREVRYSKRDSNAWLH